ncbi:hypothetical protein DITRI_Ditri20bG0053000 [Diplodiscus trichospermus]
MDLQDFIAMAVELVLKKKRLLEEKALERADQVAPQEKERELSIRKRIKEGMLAKAAAKSKKKSVDDFIALIIGDPKSNYLENAQKFDEKSLMNDILDMMNSDCSENGGFAGGYEDSNVPEIDLSLVDKAMMGAIEAQVNSLASCGGDNGGFAGGHGDSNVPRIDLGLVEKAAMDAIEALVNSVATCGDDNGGFAGDHGGIGYTAENANNLGKEGVMTPTEGTSSDGSNAGGNRRN